MYQTCWIHWVTLWSSFFSLSLSLLNLVWITALKLPLSESGSKKTNFPAGKQEVCLSLCGWSYFNMSCRVHLNFNLFYFFCPSWINSTGVFSAPLNHREHLAKGSFSSEAKTKMYTAWSPAHTPQPTHTHLCTRLSNLHIPDVGQAGIHCL